MNILLVLSIRYHEIVIQLVKYLRFLSIFFICNTLNFSPVEAFEAIKHSNYSKVFFFEDYLKGTYFWKQFIGGIFVTLAMVGCVTLPTTESLFQPKHEIPCQVVTTWQPEVLFSADPARGGMSAPGIGGG